MSLNRVILTMLLEHSSLGLESEIGDEGDINEIILQIINHFHKCGQHTEQEEEDIGKCSLWLDGVSMIVLGSLLVLGLLVLFRIWWKKTNASGFRHIILALLLNEVACAGSSMLDYSVSADDDLSWPFSKLSNRMAIHMFSELLHPVNSIVFVAAKLFRLLLSWERYKSIVFPSCRPESPASVKISLLTRILPVYLVSILAHTAKIVETELYYQGGQMEEFSWHENTTDFVSAVHELIPVQIMRVRNVTEVPGVNSNFHVSMLQHHPATLSYYIFLVHLVLTGTLPFLALIFLHYHIFKGLLDLKKRLLSLQRHRSSSVVETTNQLKDLQVGRVLLSIVILSSLGDIPHVFVNIFDFGLILKKVNCYDVMAYPAWFHCIVSGSHLATMVTSAVASMLFTFLDSGLQFQIHRKNMEDMGLMRKSDSAVEIARESAPPEQWRLVTVSVSSWPDFSSAVAYMEGRMHHLRQHTICQPKIRRRERNQRVERLPKIQEKVSEEEDNDNVFSEDVLAVSPSERLPRPLLSSQSCDMLRETVVISPAATTITKVHSMPSISLDVPTPTYSRQNSREHDQSTTTDEISSENSDTLGSRAASCYTWEPESCPEDMVVGPVHSCHQVIRLENKHHFTEMFNGTGVAKETYV